MANLPHRGPGQQPKTFVNFEPITGTKEAYDAALSFSSLKDQLQTSDGNLSVHARKLEDAGYIACKKTFQGRLPKTEYRLTPKGRRALESYLDHMEALIRATREA